MSSHARVASMAALFAIAACRARDSGASDTTAAQGTSKGTSGDLQLRVTILGVPSDPRVSAAREALGHWNRELARLGLRVRFDSGSVVSSPIPEDALRAASAGKSKPWSLLTDARLRSALDEVPGNLVIALSNTDLISFSVPLRSDRRGVVGIRRADTLPLSLPNTVRNVVAHELGHALGLTHNADSTTLMCGRPAPCRPAAFKSDTAYFFPLTAADEQSLRRAWS